MGWLVGWLVTRYVKVGNVLEGVLDDADRVSGCITVWVRGHINKKPSMTGFPISATTGQDMTGQDRIGQDMTKSSSTVYLDHIDTPSAWLNPRPGHTLGPLFARNDSR